MRIVKYKRERRINRGKEYRDNRLKTYSRTIRIRNYKKIVEKIKEGLMNHELTGLSV